MAEKNLPLKLVLQRQNDSKKNRPGYGGPKEIVPYTEEIRKEIESQLTSLGDFFDQQFIEKPLLPQVAKITVREKAVSKSNKPNRFCKNLPIIGSEKLGEIYVKVTPNGLKKTLEEIAVPPSKDFKINLTAIESINPLNSAEKIKSEFGTVSDIKVQIFDFENEADDLQAKKFVEDNLKSLDLDYNYKEFSRNVKYYSINAASKSKIEKISQIATVKSIDNIERFSVEIGTTDQLPDDNSEIIDKINDFIEEVDDSEEIIGIIDSGIEDIPFLKDSIVAREVFVADAYQNRNHGTFVASTAQFGDILNQTDFIPDKKIKFVDIIAIPNGDSAFGPVDSLNEEELMEIIRETMDKYSGSVKMWNLSLGTTNKCSDSLSTLGIFLDDIQNEYDVQFIVSAGNIVEPPLRSWPVNMEEMGEHDRLTTPADSVRSIVVGSIAQKDSDISLVKKGEPSPFSRRGPGSNYVVKPDVVDFGGNFDSDYSCHNIGMKGFDINGNIVEEVGTSFSTPRISRKLKEIDATLTEPDLLLSKALLIHSAKVYSKSINKMKDNGLVKYYGFGMPDVNINNVLQNSKDEVTLIFKQRVTNGSFLEMNPFPFPKSLIKDGKYYGEVFMTLAYNPRLDSNFGQEYSRVNLNASFGRQSLENSKYSSDIPLEHNWDNNRYEKNQIENGFKWSPIKSYYRKMRGISVLEDWKIQIKMLQRNEEQYPEQDFVLIITLKSDDPDIDLYTEMVNELRSNNYITQDLRTRNQLQTRI